MNDHRDADQHFQKMKILIADDDAPTRILLRAAISQWNYQAIEAKDGEEAWEVMQKPDAPRLLILDWLMPKLDGVALCERIKRESTSYQYIILLTQQTGTTNIIKGLEAGADEFLSKPFNMVELRSRLAVGARIVKYENSLAVSNDKVKNCALLLNQFSQSLKSVSQQISNLIEFSTGLSSADKNSFSEKVTEINNTLSTAIDTIHAFSDNKDGETPK